MSISAAFTVNAASNPNTHIAAYSSTVSLALLSTTGAGTITWTIVACSKSGADLPTITRAGTPNGSTASFPLPSDPGDGLGRAYLVKCTVSDSRSTVVEYAVVGASNAAGLLPIVPGEENVRDATHGWSQTLNQALASTATPVTTTIGAPVASIAALKAIAGADRVDNQSRAVGSPAQIWIFSLGTGANFASDDLTVVRPNDILLANNGRWYPASPSAVVPTVAALRLAVAGTQSCIQVQSYSTKGDGGGGIFDYDASDTTSTDDGGHVIVAGSCRYLRRRPGDRFQATHYGVKADGRRKSDGKLTLGAATVTSATANFKASDIGKLCILSQAPASAIGGTVAINVATATITGTGTAFLTHLVNGCDYWIGGYLVKVVAVGSDTSATMQSNAPVTVSGATLFNSASASYPIASVTSTVATLTGFAATCTVSASSVPFVVGTDDTAARDRVVAAAKVFGAKTQWPVGIMPTTTELLIDQTCNGMSFYGSGASVHTSAGVGTLWLLAGSARSAVCFECYDVTFEGITISGGRRPTDSTTLFTFTTAGCSNIHLKRCKVTEAQEGIGILTRYDDTIAQLIAAVTWDGCQIWQDFQDLSKRCAELVRNFNINAFNIRYRDCDFASGIVAFHFQGGSCNVLHAQFQQIGLYTTGGVLQLNTTCQECTWQDIYIDNNDGFYFVNHTFVVAGVGKTQFTLRDIQINSDMPSTFQDCMVWNLDNFESRGNKTFTHIADVAQAGTIASIDSTHIQGTGTSVPFAALQPGFTYIRLGSENSGELVLVTAVDNGTQIVTHTGALYSVPGGTAWGVAYGICRLQERAGHTITASHGWGGTAYPQMVDTIGGNDNVRPYSSGLPMATSICSDSWLDANVRINCNTYRAYAPPLTASRTHDVSFSGAVSGTKMWISGQGFASNTSLTLTNNGVAFAVVYAAGNAHGKVSQVEITYNGSGVWFVSSDRMNPPLVVSAVWDAPNIANGAANGTVITVTGAVLGDFVEVSCSIDLAALVLTAYVSAADTVTLLLSNVSGGAVNLASATYTVRVTRP